jgi:CheY-like chemotaxis protein
MARKYGGLGLGLAIVRHLVELHGGTVHVFSGGEHQGATFTVKLPIVMARDGQIPSTPPVSVRRPTDATSFVCPESLEGVCVLAVEDDADARHLLVTILESCKATVIAVPTVSEALQVLDQVRPDVLVSDIEMPEEDGYALIKAVQARTARDGRRIPAVALTAHTRSDDRHRVLSSGFDVHVAKPFEPPELIGVIDRLVKHYSPQGKT